MAGNAIVKRSAPTKKGQFTQFYAGQLSDDDKGIRASLRVMSRADSILLNYKVDVNFLEDAERIAYNAATIRTPMEISLPPIYQWCKNGDPLICTLGLNYHAVGHQFFGALNTDRVLGARNYINHEQGKELAQALECARVERLMIAAFPSTRPYFVQASYAHIEKIMSSGVAQDASYVISYLFLAMRPYISRNLRMSALNTVAKRNPLIAFDDGVITNLFMRYVRLSSEGKSDSTMWDESEKIVSALDRMLGNAYANAYVTARFEDLAVCMSHTANQKPPSAQSYNQQGLQDSADTQQGEGEGESSSNPGEGDGQGQGQGQSDGDGEGEDEGESQNEGSGNGAGGTSSNSQDQSFEEQIKEGLQEATEEVKNNDSSRDEYESIRDAAARAGKYESATAQSFLQNARPREQYKVLAKTMAREFAKIVEAADPGFNTHQSSGRINMKRAMHGADYDTAFDLWEEGNSEVSSFELAILSDVSGSMTHEIPAVSQAAWAITRAVESLGDAAQVTVFNYDDTCVLVKPPMDRVGLDSFKFYNGKGGTDPLLALTDTRNLMSQSKRNHKVAIILTDGVWCNEEDCNVLIRNMQVDGVHVVLAYYDNGFGYNRNDDSVEDRYDHSGHGAMTFMTINEPVALVQLARSIVKEEMRNG